jgi:hypothetical protein
MIASKAVKTPLSKKEEEVIGLNALYISAKKTIHAHVK